MNTHRQFEPNIEKQINKAEKQLFKSMLQKYKDLTKKNKRNALKNEEQALYVALTHFEQRSTFLESPSDVLIHLLGEDFNILVRNFENETNQSLIKIFKELHNSYIVECDAAKKKYETAVSCFQTYMEMYKPIDNLQSRLYDKGRDVLLAVQEVEKDGSAQQYTFLKEIIQRTHKGVARPYCVKNRRQYGELAERVRGDISIGALLSNAVLIFMGILLFAGALSFATMIPACPPMIIPAIVLASVAAVVIGFGVASIQKEIKQKKASALPKLGSACTLFHKEWNKLKPVSEKQQPLNPPIVSVVI